MLAQLTPREAKVLRMRFGIDMNTDHTLEEVGKQFDVTRERIRQIEAKALRKLRHPSRSEQLRSFLMDDCRRRSDPRRLRRFGRGQPAATSTVRCRSPLSEFATRQLSSAFSSSFFAALDVRPRRDMQLGVRVETRESHPAVRPGRACRWCAIPG